MRHSWVVLCLVAVMVFAVACKSKNAEVPVAKPVLQAETNSSVVLPSQRIMDNLDELDLEARDVILPTLAELQALNNQFVSVDVNPDLSSLSEDDRSFLTWVIMAADEIDEVYWRQNSLDGLRYRALCGHQSIMSEYDRELCQMIALNYGRYDRRTGEAFIKTGQNDMRPEVGTFYPANMIKSELHHWLSGLSPEMKALAQSPYTVIRDSELAGRQILQYSEVFGKNLEAASDLLMSAANFADSESQAAFLRYQASAFKGNDYTSADIAWVQVKDSKFMVIASAYEVYDDLMKGWKAAYEAAVGLVDQEVSETLSVVQEHLGDLEQELPMDKSYLGERRGLTPIVAVNMFYMTGQANVGVKMSAFKLPNDEAAVAKVGSKLVMNLNFQKAKFRIGMQPIAKRTLRLEQLPLATWEAYYWHNLLHECAHDIGPGQIKLVDGTETTVAKALAETGMPIEEAKADLGGFWLVPKLVALGVLPENYVEETAVMSLPGFFRSVRFGLHEAHSVANRLIYNFLKAEGVYNYDSGSVTYNVDVAKFYPAVEKMLGQLLMIEATGNYAAAKEFVAQYGGIPAEVEATVGGLTDLPIDIRPNYIGARNFGAKN